MYDEITKETLPQNVSLKIFALINDKNIYLIRAKEDDYTLNKGYIRSLLIMVRNELVTTNYADTKLLLSEIKLFERGNKQNKYTTVEKFDGDVNLKLHLTDGYIYISKAEALSITDIYSESKIGVSMARILEHELMFTPETLTMHLHNSKQLDKLGE